MAEKASRRFRRIRNPDGAVLSTVSRALLSQDGLTFKDIDGSGTVSVVNDWRRPAAERAAAYVKQLTVPEKIAQLFVADWRMAKYPAAGPHAPRIENPIHDETGILDETECDTESTFGEQHIIGTTQMLKENFYRHVILRANATPPTWPTGSTRSTQCAKSAVTLSPCRPPPIPATKTARWCSA